MIPPFRNRGFAADLPGIKKEGRAAAREVPSQRCDGIAADAHVKHGRRDPFAAGDRKSIRDRRHTPMTSAPASTRIDSSSISSSASSSTTSTRTPCNTGTAPELAERFIP